MYVLLKVTNDKVKKMILIIKEDEQEDCKLTVHSPRILLQLGRLFAEGRNIFLSDLYIHLCQSLHYKKQLIKNELRNFEKMGYIKRLPSGQILLYDANIDKKHNCVVCEKKKPLMAIPKPQVLEWKKNFMLCSDCICNFPIEQLEKRIEKGERNGNSREIRRETCKDCV